MVLDFYLSVESEFFVAQLVVLYVDFKLDESYTPSKISIRAGDGFHNLKVTLSSPREIVSRMFRCL